MVRSSTLAQVRCFTLKFISVSFCFVYDYVCCFNVLNRLAYWTYIGAGGSPETNAARKVVTEPGARFLTASNPVKTKIVTSAVSTAKTVASVITTRFKQNMFGLYVYSMYVSMSNGTVLLSFCCFFNMSSTCVLQAVVQ